MLRTLYLIVHRRHPAELVVVGTLKSATCVDPLAFVASVELAVVVVL